MHDLTNFPLVKKLLKEEHIEKILRNTRTPSFYINQLKQVSKMLDVPIITGATPINEREHLYSSFRTGEIKTIVVSKVANFSIDLPDANVAIQISGTFGSRQEEAQRLGRVLRPKADDNTAYFYTVITANSVEETFAHNRQLFLTEQGYSYTIYNEKTFFENFPGK